jgi:hypothetical protein
MSCVRNNDLLPVGLRSAELARQAAGTVRRDGRRARRHPGVGAHPREHLHLDPHQVDGFRFLYELEQLWQYHPQTADDVVLTSGAVNCVRSGAIVGNSITINDTHAGTFDGKPATSTWPAPSR